MKRRTISSLAALIIMVTATLQAAVIPGRWEKVETLDKGFQIVLLLKSGERIDCLFLRM